MKSNLKKTLQHNLNNYVLNNRFFFIFRNYKNNIYNYSKMLCLYLLTRIALEFLTTIKQWVLLQ